jgi:poly(hydroxyalkanoate) depolymerase family esterase
MRSLNDTLVRLAARRAVARAVPSPSGPDPLQDFGDFGSNPGNLHACFFVPDRLNEGAPLVVVLHGCTQDAAGYDRGSGWSHLANEYGFALLFPEQQRANNPNLCFNWFNPEDKQRESGEALSICQMVKAMVAKYRLNLARVFVTGLSAGGAMTSVMLATYPELFAGGAIIAGLPFGTADTIPEAFDRMRGHGGPDRAKLGAMVTAASSYHGPWPVISVWHGDSDATVSAMNAALIVEQWSGLHDVKGKPPETQLIGGHVRRVWRNGEEREVIEEYRITGMGHGTPLSTRDSGTGEVAGPFMLEAGISSTRRIADFWRISALSPVGLGPPPDREPSVLQREPSACCDHLRSQESRRGPK